MLGILKNLCPCSKALNKLDSGSSKILMLFSLNFFYVDQFIKNKLISILFFSGPTRQQANPPVLNSKLTSNPVSTSSSSKLASKRILELGTYITIYLLYYYSANSALHSEANLYALHQRIGLIRA